MYMAQARLAAILERVSLAPGYSGDLDRLSNFLPWGTIGPGGKIQAGDAYQVTGEPLIAVTRVPQDLADAATSCPAGARIVLIDGLRGIASDLQAFDDTAECQQVIIIASPREAGRSPPLTRPWMPGLVHVAGRGQYWREPSRQPAKAPTELGRPNGSLGRHEGPRQCGSHRLPEC